MEIQTGYLVHYQDDSRAAHRPEPLLLHNYPIMARLQSWCGIQALVVGDRLKSYSILRVQNSDRCIPDKSSARIGYSTGDFSGRRLSHHREYCQHPNS